MAGIRESIGHTASNVWNTISHPFSKKEELRRYKGTLPKNDIFIVKRNIFQRLSRKYKSASNLSNLSSYEISTINAHGDYNRRSKYDTLSLNSDSSEASATQPVPQVSKRRSEERTCSLPVVNDASYYDDIQSIIANCSETRSLGPRDLHPSIHNALFVDVTETPELKHDESRVENVEDPNYYYDDDANVYQEIDFQYNKKLNSPVINEKNMEYIASNSTGGLYIKNNQTSIDNTRYLNSLLIVAETDRDKTPQESLSTEHISEASTSIVHSPNINTSAVIKQSPETFVNELPSASVFPGQESQLDEAFVTPKTPSLIRADSPDGYSSSISDHQRLAMESVVKINVVKEEIYFLYQQVTTLINGHLGSRRDFLKLEQHLKEAFIKLRKVTSHGSGEVRQYRTEAVLETKRILKNLRRYIQAQDEASRLRNQSN